MGRGWETKLSKLSYKLKNKHIMKCTNNGLMNFEKERNEILRNAQTLIGLCQSDNGHLGDVIACVRITMSSLNITANELSKIFEQQKTANI